MFRIKTRKYETQSDIGLIDQYKSGGDKTLVGELFKRYTHLVFGVCMKYLKDEDESKDAVMQIFEKLMDSLKEHEVHNFKSWLHVTTRNHCLMQLRANKKMQKTSFDNKDVGESMENTYQLHHIDEEDKEADLQAMEKAISFLQNEQRQCIELFYLQEKSYRQIVDITGFELKKVKSYIQNGKRNLKIALQKQNE